MPIGFSFCKKYFRFYEYISNTDNETTHTNHMSFLSILHAHKNCHMKLFLKKFCPSFFCLISADEMLSIKGVFACFLCIYVCTSWNNRISFDCCFCARQISANRRTFNLCNITGVDLPLPTIPYRITCKKRPRKY